MYIFNKYLFSKMEKIYLCVFYLILSFIKEVKSENKEKYLSLPFKVEFDEIDKSKFEKEEEKVFDILTHPTMSINSEIGDPIQNIRMNLNSTFYHTYYYDSKIPLAKVKGYERNVSKRYKDVKHVLYVYIEECYNMAECQDILSFSTNQYNQENYFLVICTTIKQNRENDNKVRNGGNIGLDVDRSSSDGSTTNFISSLKGRDIIGVQEFFFDFSDKFSGNLILGKKPYEHFNNETEESYIEERCLNKGFRVYWLVNTQVIYINNKKYDFSSQNLTTLFKFEEYMFTAPSYLYALFKEHYFGSNFNNGCYELIIGNFTYIYCNKANVDITKFKPIYIQSIDQYPKNTTFEFTSSDMFYEYKDKYYFTMRFNNTNTSDYFVFGQIFLAKYHSSYNSDTKLISLSIHSYKITDDPVTPGKAPKSSILLNVVLICIIFALLVAIGIISYKKYVKGSRKMRANELDDNYVYENIKEGEKLTN